MSERVVRWLWFTSGALLTFLVVVFWNAWQTGLVMRKALDSAQNMQDDLAELAKMLGEERTT